MLMIAALSVIKCAKQLGFLRHPWLVRLMERRSIKVAAIDLANKIARIARAMMTRRHPVYRSQAALPRV
jgi:transposase